MAVGPTRETPAMDLDEPLRCQPGSGLRHPRPHSVRPNSPSATWTSPPSVHPPARPSPSTGTSTTRNSPRRRWEPMSSWPFGRSGTGCVSPCGPSAAALDASAFATFTRLLRDELTQAATPRPRLAPAPAPCTSRTDAALIGYLPAPGHLAALAGIPEADLPREHLRHLLFPDGGPRLLEELGTPLGRSAFVALPLFADELTAGSALTGHTARAVSHAASLGARCVSLAGMIPALTGYGFEVMRATDAALDRHLIPQPAAHPRPAPACPPAAVRCRGQRAAPAHARRGTARERAGRVGDGGRVRSGPARRGVRGRPDRHRRHRRHRRQRWQRWHGRPRHRPATRNGPGCRARSPPAGSNPCCTPPCPGYHWSTDWSTLPMRTPTGTRSRRLGSAPRRCISSATSSIRRHHAPGPPLTGTLPAGTPPTPTTETRTDRLRPPPPPAPPTGAGPRPPPAAGGPPPSSTPLNTGVKSFSPAG